MGPPRPPRPQDLAAATRLCLHTSTVRVLGASFLNGRPYPPSPLSPTRVTAVAWVVGGPGASTQHVSSTFH